MFEATPRFLMGLTFLISTLFILIATLGIFPVNSYDSTFEGSLVAIIAIIGSSYAALLRKDGVAISRELDMEWSDLFFLIFPFIICGLAAVLGMLSGSIFAPLNAEIAIISISTIVAIVDNK